MQKNYLKLMQKFQWNSFSTTQLHFHKSNLEYDYDNCFSKNFSSQNEA